MAHAVLADWIENYREELAGRWADSVRADTRIRSDQDLSNEGLRDHIPAVIEEICELLRSAAPPAFHNTQEGRVHAYVRFRQGYRARDLVREISLLRLTLLDHLFAYPPDKSAALSLESFAAALRLIDSYLDEEMSYAVSVYAEAMPPPE
jgi:hypothetical protein